MGHKGVSKRKPRKDKSNAGGGASSDVRRGDISSVQALVKDRDVPLDRSGSNQRIQSNKKGKTDKK